jgi:Bacterial transglutaminase-like N-terminal region
MRLFTVRHVTVYRYSEPVGLGEHRWMFRPRASHDLRLVKTSFAIVPQPADLFWIHDVFDNSVAVVTFTGQTAELRFESVVTLEHIESITPEYRLEPGARTYPFAYSSEERADLGRGLERGYPADDVRQWATGFLAPCGASGSMDTMALLRSMTAGINQQFEYRRRVERGVQSPGDTLQRGYGTCRDFALLMIEGVPVARPGRPVRERLHLLARRRSEAGRRTRRDPRLAAGLPARDGMGRFRSDQQDRRQPQSDSSRGRMGPRASAATLGDVYRQTGGFPRHGGRRKRSRRDRFINETVAGRARA